MSLRICIYIDVIDSSTPHSETARVLNNQRTRPTCGRPHGGLYSNLNSQQIKSPVRGGRQDTRALTPRRP